MSFLIEVIYKGVRSSINFSFLRDIFTQSKKIYFNSPGVPLIKNFDEVIEVINSNAYVDLVINTDRLNIYEKDVSNVFINLERNNDEIVLLLFFDLKDLKENSVKEGIDCLIKWAMEFKSEYQFNYFICQTDNAGKDEYYFDSNGVGKLYHEINC